MTNLLNAIQNMDDQNLVNYLIENNNYYTGTSEGAYFEIEGYEFEVNFNDADIIDYLGLDADLEDDIIDAYENHEDEINHHFLLQSIDTVRVDLEDQVEFELVA